MSAPSVPTQATPGAPAPGVSSILRRGPRYGELIIRSVLFLAALLSVLTTVGIVASLLEGTLEFFGEVGVGEFLTGTEWSPSFTDPQFGVLPLVGGTLLITAIALIVAVPLGIGSAIYLSEYARPRTRKIFKPILELLAGIPTIVFGYFALTFFTPLVLRDLLGMEVQIFNALSAGIIMGFMVLPTIASVSEDAMSAVPGSLREGAFGLGASKRQVSTRVVVPAALSGIAAAVILGISRAIGETMIVLVAAGQQPRLGIDPREAFETMTAFIAAQGKGDVPTGSIEYKTIFAVGTTLFLMTLAMNALSIRFVRKYRQVYE
ncbi:MAG: phosphate ABC transporter permease subunit PstC [Actinobacteria bacterium]|nr:phosphate ABC transporter permease subunit PstC [Actinomycetota bacterium]